MTDPITSRKILIVDDDPNLSAFVGRQLRAEGYTTETAVDGQDTLVKAANKPPGLVLLDLSMPVMDSIETLTSLRGWYEGPIVILSATDEDKKKVEALDLGADDYLTNPSGCRSCQRRWVRGSGR